MQDLVEKLQSKVKSYKRQFEEAVSVLGLDPGGQVLPGQDACGTQLKAGPRQEASSCQPYSTSGTCLPSVGFVGRQAAFMGSDLARDPPVPAGSVSHSSDKR